VSSKRNEPPGPAAGNSYPFCATGKNNGLPGAGRLASRYGDVVYGNYSAAVPANHYSLIQHVLIEAY